MSRRCRPWSTEPFYWVSPDLFVPALGAFEMFVGLMLLFRRALRLTLFLLVAQMVGTFLTFIILSEVTDGTRCC